MISPIDEIKSRLDIIEVIGSYIKVHKAGANYRAACPFHTEKKPSFFISPARQIWHCFGCSKGGDMFGFVKEIEGVEFGDALRILAQKAGVELKRETPEFAAFKSERQHLYDICELATRFFEKQLEESNTGKEVKKYLLARGITQESIRKWRIGYAPDVWQGLSDFLLSRKYHQEEIKKAGLGLSSEKGSFYDRFRGRIIFPIFDLNSQVIGFGGRIFGEKKEEKEIAKYVNTPQTLLYDKGRTLYGLDKAKVEIRKKDHCILVEGYMDLIMASQTGSSNVVATSGTALTPFQLKILKRYSENILTAFDMDIAGDSATKRGIELAQAQGFNVRVVVLPEGMDPADTILKDPKEWENRANTAKSIMDFYFESTFAKFDKIAPDGKREISKILLPIIKKIPNTIIQSHWIGKLVKDLGVREEDVRTELKKTKIEEYPASYGLEEEEIKNIPVQTRKEMLEERVIILILKSLEKENVLNVVLNNKDLFENLHIKELLDNLKNNSQSDMKNVSPELAELFDYLFLKAEIEEIDEKEIVPEIENCLMELKYIHLKNKLKEISKGMKEAEYSKNIDNIEKLSQEFNSYSLLLDDLENKI